MAQQSLYRRYRPRRFGELKGQEHVVRALQNAVAKDAEGHAYLFSGPRGTGKTSTARILAKALNCTNLTDGEPCCECDACVSLEAGRSFDLFELDAASNNGVDAVRDLVERSAVASPGRTKVYILDEVHMLTAAASNALLKTLEEPPDHVRFVLATTDPQKVLPTIRSRTQHYEFQLLSAAELEAHVRWVVEDADLDVDDEAVAHAVRQGRGSVRDTLSALDQVVAAGGVLVRVEPVEQLFVAMSGGDSGVAMVAVAEALAQGHDPRVLGEAFLGEIRNAFLLSLGVETPHVLEADRERLGRWATEIGTPGLTRAMERVGQALVDMRNAPDPRVPLEVALVQLTMPAEPESAAGTSPPAASGSTASGSAGDDSAAVARLSKDLAAMRERLDRLEAADGGRIAAPTGRTAAAQAQPEKTQPEKTQPAKASTARQDASRQTPTRSGPSPTRSGPSPTRSGPSRGGPPPPPPRRATRSGPAPARKSPQADAHHEAPPEPTQPSPESSAPASPSEPTSPPESSPAPAQVEAHASTSRTMPDRDALVLAFGDVVVPQLRGVAKAIFTGGRFVAVADDTAVFSLDNAPTRERAEKYRGQVEQMLGEHFGTPVSLRLVIESEAGAYETGSTTAPAVPAAPAPRDAAGDPPESGKTAPQNPGPQNPGPQNPGPQNQQAQEAPVATAPDPKAEEAELMAHVDQLEDADVTTSGIDKLTDAFPGAQLIETEESTG